MGTEACCSNKIDFHVERQVSSSNITTDTCPSFQNVDLFNLYPRHLAAVAALIILALQIFGFFVQQLFNVRTWWWPDMSLPIDSNAKPIQSYYQTLHNHPNLTLDLPPQLQLAQIANVTTYDQYNGAGPCKSKYYLSSRT